MTNSMRRNLRLLPFHQALTGTLAWLPVLVLFTRRSFGIDGAFELGAIFYFATVVTEVPSGWASDRFGRVVTLKAAAALTVVSHLFFALSDHSFLAVAIGEVLLASGFSAISGTDVSLHYDTLESLHIEEEYERRQSRLVAISYAAVSASAIIGGLLGWVDLRLVFWFSTAAALVQFALAWQLAEPPRQREAHAAGFATQLESCMRYLRQPLLRWVLAFWIAMVTLEHVAFTLAQPYMTEALGFSFDDVGSTPLWTGALFAMFSLIGAIAAANAANLRQRLGFVPLLLGLAFLSAGIVSAMVVAVSIWVAALIALRSVLGAVAPVVMTSEIAPVIDQSQRATYLSIHSLAGRLVYGSLMFGAARTIGDDLFAMIDLFAAASWVLIAIVVVLWFALRPKLPAATA